MILIKTVIKCVVNYCFNVLIVCVEKKETRKDISKKNIRKCIANQVNQFNLLKAVNPDCELHTKTNTHKHIRKSIE